GFKGVPNDKVIFRYLSQRKHDDGRATFFEGVYRLLPGEWGLISKDGLKTEKYYELKLNHKVQGSEKEQVAKFRELFVRSVKDRLMSEVPVGTCLSGGLDSSAVVCVINSLLKSHVLAKETIGLRQKTFSAVFPSQINNEEDYINEVLNFTETERNFVYPKDSELFSEIEKLVYHQEEPFISSGPYAQWCVMRLAESQVKVLLDGQGSDEILAGYNPYILVYLNQLLKKGNFLTLILELAANIPLIIGILTEELAARFKNIPRPLSLINPTFKDEMMLKYSDIFSSTVTDNLKKRLYEDLFKDSIPALLRYEDKNSMAFSIEGRVPFLDRNLVEFIFSLDEKMLIRNGKTKYILREALKDLLPRKIIARKWKVGFTTPEVGWFRNQREEVNKIIDSDSFRSRKYFDFKKIRKYVDDFLSGKHDESMVIWRLINLEIWLRVFFP
ncbi:asparagine synthase C-terminal domain-containing protein, partial [candidate division WWE3 bacterium]|nr:asparagine synthase C-terminal domain-containing protein [candidate division WWE3 bacterium]